MWKEIETAPKSRHEKILAYHPKWESILVSWFDDDTKCWIGGGYTRRQYPPIYWMELPAPPASYSEI